jgi:hypothetical protein
MTLSQPPPFSKIRKMGEGKLLDGIKQSFSKIQVICPSPKFPHLEFGGG